MTPEWVRADEPRDVSEALLARFTATFGTVAAGVHAAPGRVNLIGEHVDYNGGRCLPMALPHATYAAVAPRRDQTVRIASTYGDGLPWEGTLDGLGPGDVSGWVAYVAGVLWALRQRGWDVPGVDILVDSRVPVGAGLSSSAALECSVGLAVAHLLGLGDSEEVRRELVTACIRAETDVAGAPTGGMDQTVSLLGHAGHALLLDCLDGSTRQVPWGPGDRELELLVVDTRAEHQLTDGAYASRRQDCERAATALGVPTLREVTDPAAALAALEDERVARRARHVFTELDRVTAAVAALEEGDVEAFGRALDASHTSLRDDFEVSCDELDTVVEVARKQGALGARMTGGGFGGSAIALVHRRHTEGVAAAVVDAFAARGWRAPGFLVAEPSAGAHRVV